MKTIHAGDLFTRGAPFIDYKGGGSTIEWTKTLTGALAWDFDTAIPGHGAVGTRADFEQHIKNVGTMRDRMTELVRKGVPREQAGEQLKVDDFGWSLGALQKGSMAAFYDEMSGKK